jgi:hypothetical protein
MVTGANFWLAKRRIFLSIRFQNIYAGSALCATVDFIHAKAIEAQLILLMASLFTSAQSVLIIGDHLDIGKATWYQGQKKHCLASR